MRFFVGFSIQRLLIGSWTKTDDEQLLRQFAEECSESAFGELVTRYIDLVYSAVLRALNGDVHLAQDVTQTVFIDLARKAGACRVALFWRAGCTGTPVIPPPHRCERSGAAEPANKPLWK